MGLVLWCSNNMEVVISSQENMSQLGARLKEWYDLKFSCCFLVKTYSL